MVAGSVLLRTRVRGACFPLEGEPAARPSRSKSTADVGGYWVFGVAYETHRKTRHWLIDVADSVGLRDLQLDSGAEFPLIRAAWAEIARTAEVSEDALAERVAEHFQLEVADLSIVEPQAAKLLPEKTARKYGVLPLQSSDQMIVVATSDPVNFRAEHDIQFLSGRQPLFKVAAPGPLFEAIDAAYARSKIVDFVLQNLAAEAVRDEVEIVRDKPEETAEDLARRTQPVANLVKRILRQAANVGATEVVVETERGAGRVRFRIDGLLEHFMHLPAPALIRVVKRLKELARLDTSLRVEAQEGQLTASVKGRRYVLRVRSEPDAGVERVSVRITDPNAAVPLDSLKLPKPERERIESLLRQDRGLITLVGPWRSGMSHLLTACARTAVSFGRSVSTVDTRVDIDLEGINQIQADPDAGFGFAPAVARALEDSPEVLVVARVPDAEAARLLIDAARSSTLVVVGLEADEPIEAIPLLTQFQIARPDIASALIGIVGHRLMRRLCPACSREVTDPNLIPVTERALAKAYGVTPARLAVGCSRCRNTGFRGRLLATSTLQVSPEVANLIAGGGLASEIERVAMTDVESLAQACLSRVEEGETLLQEMERVLPSRSSDEAGPDRDAPKILVVDDSAEIGELIDGVLTGKGFKVAHVHDGAEAINRLEVEDDTSLVLLDLQMPGLNGRQVLNRIRGNLRTAGLPVIILTAEDDPDVELDLLEAGADDYLRKPVDPSRLAVRVRAVLRRAGVSDQGAQDTADELAAVP